MVLIKRYLLSAGRSIAGLGTVGRGTSHVSGWTPLHAAGLVNCCASHLVHFEHWVRGCLGTRSRRVRCLGLEQQLLLLAALTISTGGRVWTYLALLQAESTFLYHCFATVFCSGSELRSFTVRDHSLLFCTTIEIMRPCWIRQNLIWFNRGWSTFGSAATSSIVAGIGHHSGVETARLTVLSRHRSVHLLLESTMRRMRSPQIDYGHHWVSANWITLITLGTIHEPRMWQVSSRIIWAVRIASI